MGTDVFSYVDNTGTCVNIPDISNTTDWTTTTQAVYGVSGSAVAYGGYINQEEERLRKRIKKLERVLGPEKLKAMESLEKLKK